MGEGTRRDVNGIGNRNIEKEEITTGIDPGQRNADPPVNTISNRTPAVSERGFSDPNGAPSRLAGGTVHYSS